MNSDSYMVPEGHVCPRSFGGLMALYESNYIKLSHFLGGLQSGERHLVSSSPSDFALHLNQSAADSARYTQDLQLTYLFDDDDKQLADPDLHVRIYRDARMVEVRSWADHHRHNTLLHLRRSYGRELDRRWARNVMFSKWLDYLVERGHVFAEARSLELSQLEA